jgi:hypothetical protein
MNSLILSIQDGSIFTSPSYVADLVTTLDGRVDVLEDEVAALNLGHIYVFAREQFVLTVGQSAVTLEKTPKIDSEQVFLSGAALSKTDIPSGYEGEYSISGSTITLSNTIALNVQDGDGLIVTYAYEV